MTLWSHLDRLRMGLSAYGDQRFGDMIYRFKDFEFDSVRESLTGPDGPIALRDQAGRVLKFLIERAPQVVSKDQILDEVWGHDALSESSIPQAIKDIRTALDDSAKRPEIVLTRYGRGYQFVAELTRRAAKAAASNASKDHEPGKPRSGWFSRWSLALSVLVLVGIILYPKQPWQSPSATDESDSQVLVLRAVAGDQGESLSEPFVRYLGFVLRQALGNDRISIASSEEPLADSARLDVSLSVRDQLDDGNRFTLALAANADTTMQRQADQAADLLQTSLDEIYARFDIDKIEPEVGLTSTSGYATETLLRGMTAQFAGELDRAREMFEAALAEDPDFDFARYELAITLRRMGEYQRALAMLMALEVRHKTPFWSYKINNAAGIALWRLGRLDEALLRLRAAQAIAQSAGAKSISHINIALVLRDQQQIEQSEAEIQLAITYAVEAESQRLEASARNTLASLLIRLGRPEEALGELQLAERLYYDEGNRAGYAAVLSRSGHVYRRQGRFDLALQKTRLATDVRQQIGDVLGAASSLFAMADIGRRLGQFDQSRIWIDQALALMEGFDDLNLLHRAQIRLAELALARQRPDDAVLHAAESLRLAELRDDGGDQLDSQLTLLASEFMQGRSADAVMAELNELLRGIDPETEPTRHARARLFQGRVALSQDDRLAARATFEVALELASERQLTNEQIEILHQLVEFHLETDVEVAKDYLDRASALDPTAYPHLLLQARILSLQNRDQDALAKAMEARQTAGDWWNAEDEEWLDELQTSMQSNP